MIKTNKLVSPDGKEIEVGKIVKSENGEVKDIDGNPLTIDEANKIGGKTYNELIQDVDNTVNQYSYKSKFNFKKILNTERSFPERWMCGVNQDNQIILWGYRNTYMENTGSSDSMSATALVVPNAVAGVEPQEIVATTWGLYVLYPNGDLYVRGYNGYGQLGTGNTVNQVNGFVKVAEDVVKVVSSSHGYHQDHNSVFIIKLVDGKKKLYGTGANGYGQLGRGHTTTPMTSFGACQFTSDFTTDDEIVDVFVNSTDVVTVYALTNTGKLFSCGYNNYGQLGLGDTTNRNIFHRVGGLLDGKEVVEFVCGGGTRSGNSAYYNYSAIARTSDGKCYGWGYNGYGQLGLGNTNQYYTTPQEIVFLADKNIVKLFGFRGSWTNFFALSASGVAYGWGYNNFGSLGIGSTSTSISTPTRVQISDAIKDIYLGAGSGTYCYHHGTMFVTQDGKVYVTGYNGQGQVGDNLGNASTPRLINFPDNIAQKGIKQVATGGYSSEWSWYLLLNNGDLYGWGENGYQQIRLNDSADYISYPSLFGI